MKRAIILLVLLAGCTSFAYQEQTESGSKYVLHNGLTALLKENHDTGMVAIDLVITRSIAADMNLPGLGHFTNRMLLAGTKTRTRDELNNEIESAGGSIKARTYAEYSEITIEVPSDKLSVALRVLQDVIRNPAFDDEEIKKERTKIVEEIESKKDQPHIQSEELFMKSMFRYHPYENPIDGYKESVSRITKEDLLEHYRKWYVPNEMIISIVGNIDKQATAKAIQALFGTMRPGETPVETIPVPRHTTPNIEQKDMPIESMYIQQGYQLIPARHPDFIKARMAQAILGSGSGSRLFYNLRDKQALAYTVYAMAPSVRTDGFLKIVMISRPAVLNESLRGINEQVEKLKHQPVPKEEMDLVKQKIRGFFYLDHQRTADQANYLAFYEMQGLGYEWDINYPDELDKVTAGDVQYVANKYFVNPQTAVVGPFEEDLIR